MTTKVCQFNYLLTDPNKYLINYRTLMDDPDGMKYQAIGKYWLYIERYDKWILIDNDKSDGTTGAFDIHSNGPWWHDNLCKFGRWHDGTRLTNWQASVVFAHVIWREAVYWRMRGRYFFYLKRRFQAITGFIATLLFGGGEARRNGVFRLKKELR